MPTIKTIKPAGGGDYTTLAAWWSARRTSGNADEWAECYSGGNLGGVTITGMTATTNATDYPKIYAATPHDGKTYNSGAYISGAGITVYTDYTQIVGLGLNGQIYTEYHGNSFLTIDSCIVHIASGVGMYLRDVNVSGERNVTNCNIKSGDNWGLLLIADAGLAITCLIANNTFNGTAYGIYIGASGYASFDVTLNNNAILATIYGVYEPGSYNTVRSSNNAASDTSVNGPPGSYSNWIVGTNITGVAATDLFEDAAGGDIRPKPGSALIHAGANLIADFTQDIVGHERPSVGPWDIGAFEYVPPYVEYDISYTYDAVGNRLTKVDVHEGTTTYTYDAANQLLSEVSPLGTINYAYDLNGNRIQKDDPVTGITNYTYDETNRMLTADPAGGQLVSLTYNGADQVVVKQNSAGTRKFVYDFKKLLLETKADNSTDLLYDFALNDEYGELTSRYHDATAGTDYYQYDGLGSTETMSDEAEAAVDVYRYKAFGEIVQQFGTEDNDFTFVGRQGYFYYPELELYFAGMQGGTGKPGRLLDPKTGQWTSQDPIRDNETNLYCYVRNNPVNATDPSGNEDHWDPTRQVGYAQSQGFTEIEVRTHQNGGWIGLNDGTYRVFWIYSPQSGEYLGKVITPLAEWKDGRASPEMLDNGTRPTVEFLMTRGTVFNNSTIRGYWLQADRTRTFFGSNDEVYLTHLGEISSGLGSESGGYYFWFSPAIKPNLKIAWVYGYSGGLKGTIGVDFLQWNPSFFEPDTSAVDDATKAFEQAIRDKIADGVEFESFWVKPSPDDEKAWLGRLVLASALTVEATETVIPTIPGIGRTKTNLAGMTGIHTAVNTSQRHDFLILVAHGTTEEGTPLQTIGLSPFFGRPVPEANLYRTDTIVNNINMRGDNKPALVLVIGCQTEKIAIEIAAGTKVLAIGTATHKVAAGRQILNIFLKHATENVPLQNVIWETNNELARSPSTSFELQQDLDKPSLALHGDAQGKTLRNILEK